jgi:hypothetical protein
MDDVSVPGRWELGVPVDQQGREVEDPWMFKNGVPVRVDGRLQVPMTIPGKSLDFSLARTWGWTIALIVSEEVKGAMERIGVTGTKFREV